jgi:hypothetical protein
MAKHRKKHKNKSFDWRLGLLIVLLVLLATAIWLSVILSRSESPELSLDSSYPQEVQPTETNPTETNPTETNLTETNPTENSPDESDSTEEESQAATDTGEQDPAPATEDSLPDGLRIVYMTSYAGIYMEDGSDEVVSDVMMLVLENTADKDLQLARIRIEYSDFTAEFEVTNLPAGEKVVALEKNRHPKPAEEYRAIMAKNIQFFPKKMSLQEERIRVTGVNGSLEVENISGEDITGDIWIYYKHSASDLLYGGITYRVSVKGGLAAGEKIRVIAGHYMVDSCRILQVDCGE